MIINLMGFVIALCIAGLGWWLGSNFIVFVSAFSAGGFLERWSAAVFDRHHKAGW